MSEQLLVVEKLRKTGIPVTIGHSADNLGDAAVVVCSTAIKENNPEFQAAAERRLPRVRRAEMLAELMRMQKTVAVAGTHGKTTTTSMVAALLDGGGVDPTVINGGIINRYGSNARLGKSDWWVIGRWLGDGHLDAHGYPHISCSVKEVSTLTAALGKRAGHTRQVNRGTMKFRLLATASLASRIRL